MAESTPTRGADWVPQYAVSPNGGGRLPLGNHPGNTGGKKGRSGPKPSAIRRACLKALGPRIVHLRAIADGVAIEEVKGPNGRVFALKSPEISDRLKALDMIAKIGLGAQTSVEDVRERLRETLSVLRDELSQHPEALERVVGRLGGVWK